MMQNKNIENLTHKLLIEIGETPSREGLLKTPSRVAKAWGFFSKGYKEDLYKVINDAIFNEKAKDLPKLNPTDKHTTKPGPAVEATASISSIFFPLSSIAF